MALFVKDPEVGQLADRLVVIRKVTKTEAVRQALLHELEREEARPSLIDRGVEFCRALRARSNPAQAMPAEKDFIDSLYENR
jgi:antitoxin VapB